MGNALHPNERTLIYMLRKISVALGKTIVSLILIALLAIFVTSVSPVYDFSEAISMSETMVLPNATDIFRSM